MEFRIDYYSASGVALANCSFLAQRYLADVGFRPGEGECHVVTISPSRTPGFDHSIWTSFHTVEWLTGLWRSVEGDVFVSASRGRVYRVKNLTDNAVVPTWEHETLDASLWGIWGLASNDVYCWGTRDDAPVLFHFDGQRWSEQKAPPFGIESMHGTGPDLILASGAGGGVARLQGGAWRLFQTSVQEMLVNVHVAGPDEYYAVGNGGSVLEGSDHGWTRIGEIPDTMTGDVQAVAKWGGHLWVGASRLGLFRRIGTTHQFERYKPKLTAVSFDTRGKGLLTGCDFIVAESLDGTTFAANGSGVVAKQRGTKPIGKF